MNHKLMKIVTRIEESSKLPIQFSRMSRPIMYTSNAIANINGTIDHARSFVDSEMKRLEMVSGSA